VSIRETGDGYSDATRHERPCTRRRKKSARARTSSLFLFISKSTDRLLSERYIERRTVWSARAFRRNVTYRVNAPNVYVRATVCRNENRIIRGHDKRVGRSNVRYNKIEYFRGAVRTGGKRFFTVSSFVSPFQLGKRRA